MINSDIQPLTAVETISWKYEENCKLLSLGTIQILHRPNGGGQEDDKGDRMGGSTSEESGKEDQTGEVVEEWSSYW